LFSAWTNQPTFDSTNQKNTSFAIATKKCKQEKLGGHMGAFYLLSISSKI
jgi:hypothetical protein